MEDVCRFCLSTHNTEMRNFRLELDLMHKIESLNIKVLFDELLPCNVCKECTLRIEEMCKFQQTVKQNEETLLYHLNQLGSLESFIESLKSIKKEDHMEDSNGFISLTDINKDKKYLSESESKIKNVEEVIVFEHEVTAKHNKLKSKRKLITSFKNESSVIVTNDTGENDHTYLEGNLSDSSDDKPLTHIKSENDPDCTGIENITPNETVDVKMTGFAEILPNNIIDIKIAGNAYKCLTCFEMHNTQKDLMQHYEYAHRHNKVDKNNLKEHYRIIKSENGIVNFKCMTCDKMYKSKRDMDRHLIYTHSEERPFVCKICGRAYKTVYEIILHDRAHSRPKLFCKYRCGYSTAYPGALKEHERRHSKEYKYKCNKCNKGFNVRTWYEQHQNLHLGLKPYKCHICSASFHMEKLLTMHRTRHPQAQAEKRYECPDCGLPCDTKRTLTDHLKTDHSKGEDGNVLCDFCGKVVSSKALRLHLKKHEMMSSRICNICGKGFLKKYDLERHMDGHANNRAHVCVNCHKAFIQKSSLMRHLNRKHNVYSDRVKRYTSDTKKNKKSPIEPTAPHTQENLIAHNL